MSKSEVRVLREEVARLIAECRGHIKDKESILRQNGELRAHVAELTTELSVARAELKRQDGYILYHENPNSPPSSNSIRAQRRKRTRSNAGSAKSPVPAKSGTPGRKKGHKGVTAGRKADRTTHHRIPDRCPKCSSSRMIPTQILAKLVYDIDFLPECIATNHVVHESVCGNCGTGHTPRIPDVKGTSLGPNLASIAVCLYHNGMSTQNTTSTLDGIFHVNRSKGTIQHALQAASAVMEPCAEQIRKDLAKSEFLHIDETPYPVQGSRSSHVWAAVGTDSVHYKVSGTRGGAVLDEFYPHFDVPLTSDGYRPYKKFRTQQRCFAHILREAEALACLGRTEELLYRQLRLLYHRAKRSGPDKYDSLVHHAGAIAGQYTAIGCKYGCKLADAVPNLFTFVKHPGMEPTNNKAERALRRIVIQRKIRYGLRTTGGMRMLGTIMTCMETWRMRGPDVIAKLQQVLAAA